MTDALVLVPVAMFLAATVALELELRARRRADAIQRAPRGWFQVARRSDRYNLHGHRAGRWSWVAWHGATVTASGHAHTAVGAHRRARARLERLGRHGL